MRLLRVIASADRKIGGPIEGAIQISRVLAAQGHVTEIASLDAPDQPWMAELPFPVHALGPARTGYAYSDKLVPWLLQNAPDYDAVVVHGLWQYHGFATRQALRRLGKPYVLYTHGMLDPWFKKTYPLKHLKKMLYWPWGEYRVLRDAQAVCFTCEEERVLARESFAMYRCNEVVVNYGTAAPDGDPDAQREAFLSEHPDLRGKRLLLFLSRIHVKKGCDLLLGAFAAVAGTDPALRLVMAGPDQTGWRAQLQQQAENLGIADRVVWPGMLSGDLKWGAFRAAEAFVLPSHQENFGIAVAEALACGLPVLISDKVNIWREIQADGAGLVAADTVEGTRGLLQEWLALPADSREEMRRQARQSFGERFEITNAARSFLNVLQAQGAKAEPCPQY